MSTTPTRVERDLARVERNIRRLLHSGHGRAHQTRRIWRWKRQRTALLAQQPAEPMEAVRERDEPDYDAPRPLSPLENWRQNDEDNVP